MLGEVQCGILGRLTPIVRHPGLDACCEQSERQFGMHFDGLTSSNWSSNRVRTSDQAHLKYYSTRNDRAVCMKIISVISLVHVSSKHDLLDIRRRPPALKHGGRPIEPRCGVSSCPM